MEQRAWETDMKKYVVLYGTQIVIVSQQAVANPWPVAG
jgi:hypothetical protein